MYQHSEDNLFDSTSFCERVDSLTGSEFFSHYLKKGHPVIVSKEPKLLELCKKWNFEYFMQHFGQEKVNVAFDMESTSRTMQLWQFLSIIRPLKDKRELTVEDLLKKTEDNRESKKYSPLWNLDNECQVPYL